jgi:SAM-dependent methyltransferase
VAPSERFHFNLETLKSDDHRASVVPSAMSQVTPQGGSLDPYREALKQHGATFEATLWRNRDAQKSRFAVLADLFDLTDRVVLDAGCALGDFCAYLSEERDVRYSKYIGIDGLGEIISAASARGLARAEFFERDFVVDADALTIGQADVICFSGSLNTVPEDEARVIVERAFAIARIGVAFNFLSDRCTAESARKDPGPASRFDTLGWVAWALDRTVRVQFRQDYLNGHDATIAMARE